jgi:uncharacterized protein (TIGR00369 family)
MLSSSIVMQARHPASLDQARAIFDQCPFVRDLGVRLDNLEPGRAQSSLTIEPRHLQQDGLVHAGVQATIADHTAGGAAAGVIDADHTILSIEFKINLLRPAKGPELICRASVLRAGRTVIVAESEVFDRDEQGERLTAKAMVTLAVVKLRPDRP